MERQDESIEYTVKARGDTLVAIAHDTDVSGSVSPFDREGLGPWLTDPAKVGQWDYLVFTKLDRLTRSLGDFDDLVQWCDRNGKTLVSISESIDLSTYVGRMLANILAMFAQFERERMADRARDSHAKSKANGWWHGGNPPYGYEPYKVDSHFELRVNEAQAMVIRAIVAAFLSGMSRNAIARDLNANRVPSPYGKQWHMIAVNRVLEASGSFVSVDDFGKVRDRLDVTSNPVTRRENAPMLLNVAYCTCGSPLYSCLVNHKNRSTPAHEYYRCYGKCGARLIPMPTLDAEVDTAMVDTYGWVPVWTKSHTRGKSYAKEIAAVERQIRQLDQDADDYDDQHAALRAEAKRLKSLPTGDDFIDFTPTGKTLEVFWPTLDAAAKRRFLLDNKVKVYAKRDSRDVSVVIGPDADTLEGGDFFTMISDLACFVCVS